MIGSAATIECRTIDISERRSSSAAWRRTYSATSRVPAGTAGKIYPGSFDLEREKKITGTTSQTTRNTLNLSSDSKSVLLSVHHARRVSHTARAAKIVHGTSANSITTRKYQNGCS